MRGEVVWIDEEGFGNLWDEMPMLRMRIGMVFFVVLWFWLLTVLVCSLKLLPTHIQILTQIRKRKNLYYNSWSFQLGGRGWGGGRGSSKMRLSNSRNLCFYKYVYTFTARVVFQKRRSASWCGFGPIFRTRRASNVPAHLVIYESVGTRWHMFQTRIATPAASELE